MRFAASRGQHPSLYAHGNRTRQHSCSHFTAICNQKANKRIESRTHEQPLVEEHRGGTDSTLKRPQPHPPHTQATCHRRLQPLYTEKHKVSCSGFSPNQTPCNIHAAIKMQPLQCVLQHHVANTHLSTRMATEHDNIHAAISLRSATRESTNAKNQTLVAEHRRGTDSTLKRPQPHPPHPPHTQATCHRRLQPLYTEKHKVSCSGFSLYQTPCSIHAAIKMQPLQCVLQHHVANTHLAMHMATEHDNIHAANSLRSATRKSTNA